MMPVILRYLTREYQSQQPDDDFKFDHKNLPAEYPKVGLATSGDREGKG